MTNEASTPHLICQHPQKVLTLGQFWPISNPPSGCAECSKHLRRAFETPQVCRCRQTQSLVAIRSYHTLTGSAAALCAPGVPKLVKTVAGILRPFITNNLTTGILHPTRSDDSQAAAITIQIVYSFLNLDG